MNGEQLGWRRECADADELLRHLGLDPERCRTDGGWLNLPRIKTLLAESPQPAPSEPAVTRWNFQTFEDWWGPHGFHNASAESMLDAKPLMKLAWDVAREQARAPRPAAKGEPT